MSTAAKILGVTALALALVAPAWAGCDGCASCAPVPEPIPSAEAAPVHDSSGPSCHDPAPSEAGKVPEPCGESVAPDECGACMSPCNETQRFPQPSEAIAPAHRTKIAEAMVAADSASAFRMSAAPPPSVRLDRLLESARPPLPVTLFHVHSLLLN